MNPTSGPGEEPAGAPRPVRRAVLRAVFTAAVLAGTGGALAPVLLQGQGPGGPGQERDAVGPERFSELYKGREIRGTATTVVPAGAQAHAGTSIAAPAADVSVDGRTLHVMRRADGSYLSTVTHYESFPTLLETARAAVDELGTAQLSAVSPHTI
ncbi:tyrosinase cofactor [[Kitasatospora] papulosa]|uniref:Tyrosinase cofactor n=3 Tax=Streptomyces TaxID=1883 RepID=A0ABZ1JVY7_9ACTN|nr:MULTISPECIES: tyrosinase family oxidase copper chaperone [Streptomyces]MBD2830852.1 tyrosinase [Streptomyces pratensis]MCX4418019.1 tyrosinase cofactor [[Kitasatospora] papulosa]MCY1649906.1 tyrosinase family oxidase copper chaperone [Streptomyces sp. SL203]MDX2618113.1 tyrosinase family oxidase copper chaperone [Streptomyces sp. WI03-5b]WJY29869.1 tyrosinase family oxidase copper chaperone [Streptomyces sp. P9-2B-1]